jgi:hypothetical protein
MTNFYAGTNLKPNVNLYSDLGRDLLLNLDPLIYTDGYGGITYGAQAEQIILTSWIKVNVTSGASGDGYVITNTNATGNHNVYLSPALQPTRVAGPYLFQADFKKDIGSAVDTIMIEIYQSLQLKVNLTTGESSFVQQTNLETSYPVGDGYLSDLGDGWYRVILRSKNISAASDTPAIYMYDKTGKDLSWNGFGVDGRILVKNIITEQKRVLYWTDLRNGHRWEQATAANQPIYWVDGFGPGLVFVGVQYMLANNYASLFSNGVPCGAIGAATGVVNNTKILYSITNVAQNSNMQIVMMTSTSARFDRESPPPNYEHSLGSLSNNWDNTYSHFYNGAAHRGSIGSSYLASADCADNLTFTNLYLGHILYLPTMRLREFVIYANKNIPLAMEQSIKNTMRLKWHLVA